MAKDDWMEGRVAFGSPEHFKGLEKLFAEKDDEIAHLKRQVKLLTQIVELEFAKRRMAK